VVLKPTALKIKKLKSLIEQTALYRFRKMHRTLSSDDSWALVLRCVELFTIFQWI